MARPRRLSPRVRVSILMPSGYMRMLRTEAACYGLGTSQFAEQLLRHTVGLPSVTPRPSDAPRYQFSEEDLRCREPFLWLLPQELLTVLATACFAIGCRRNQQWLMRTLDRWVGRENVAGPAVSLA